MRIFLRFALCFLFIHFCTLKSQTAWEALFAKKTFSSASGKLPFRLYVPDSINENLPLLVFLHGAGERGTDNEKQLLHGVKYFMLDSIKEQYKCIIVAPQCPENKRWVEVDWKLQKHIIPENISTPLNLTFLMLDSLIKEYPIDTDRIYITGISMGGFGTWDAMARRPDFFAAAMPVCGGGDENTACLLKNIPIKAFHGKLDKLVVPARTTNMVNAIKKCNGNAESLIFANLGHFCWDNVYSNVENIRWLFTQKKQK